MAFSFEYHEMSKYVKDFQRVGEKEWKDFLKGFLAEMAQRILAKTKEKTPVDTGNLRSSWQVGEPYFSGKDLCCEIKNGAEYASFVEYGHRIVRGGTEIGWHEGRFMLRISTEEIRRQMPLRFAKEFAQFCKEHGVG